MKKLFFFISLVLCIGLTSCSAGTKELRKQVKQDIIDEIKKKDNNIKVIDFQLVHCKGNYYNGILTTKEYGIEVSYEVSVIFDGENYQWRIL